MRLEPFVDLERFAYFASALAGVKVQQHQFGIVLASTKFDELNYIIADSPRGDTLDQMLAFVASADRSLSLWLTSPRHDVELPKIGPSWRFEKIQGLTCTANVLTAAKRETVLNWYEAGKRFLPAFEEGGAHPRFGISYRHSLLLRQSLARIDQHRFHHYLGFKHDRVAASVTVFVSGHTAGLYDLAVLPYFQKRGLGTEALHYGATIAVKQGAREIVVQTDSRVSGFFSKQGFSSVQNGFVFY